MTAVTVPAKVARNLTRSFFEMAHKRCNSNGPISKSEICGGELRATLMRSRWGLAGQRADVPNHTPAHQAPLVWRRRRAWRPGCGARGRRWGLDGIRTVTTNPTGVEGAGGIGGPGCGARGWRRGLAGLRADAPSEARGADGSRAGRRPRAHQAARPHGRALRCPEHPWGSKLDPENPWNAVADTERGPKRRGASGPLANA